MTKPIILILLFLSSANVMSAQGLILDNSFGNNGIWIGQNTSEINDIALQTDNKIVSAGYSIDSSISNWQVARHNDNGSVDMSFGTNGFVQTSIGYYQDLTENVAVQADGKIITVGTYQDYQLGPYHTGICRYKTNGQLDSTFANNGFIRLSYGQQDGMTAMKIQTDGKIVLGGSIVSNGSSYFSLIRLKTNGDIDSTFGNNGLVTTNFNNPSVIYDIEILSDGSILACGYEGVWGFGVGANTQFALTKYYSSGILDNSFGNNGSLLLNINSGWLDVATEIDVLSSGKILLSGYSMDCLALVQLLPNGSMDNTFAQNGIFARNGILDTSCNPVPTSTNILSSGKFLVSGIKPINTYDAGFNIIRFNINGSKDSTFGTNGSFESNVTNNDDYVQDAILTSSGKYLCAGSSDSKNLLSRYDFGTPTSVKAIDNFKNITIYPNPTHGEIQISFHLKEMDVISIDLINNLGQSVKPICTQKNFVSGQHNINIDLGSIAAGNYFLNLSTTATAISKKIIVHQ